VSENPASNRSGRSREKKRKHRRSPAVSREHSPGVFVDHSPAGNLVGSPLIVPLAPSSPPADPVVPRLDYEKPTKRARKIVRLAEELHAASSQLQDASNQLEAAHSQLKQHQADLAILKQSVVRSGLLRVTTANPPITFQPNRFRRPCSANCAVCSPLQ
jgi:hypothetical protein